MIKKISEVLSGAYLPEAAIPAHQDNGMWLHSQPAAQ